MSPPVHLLQWARMVAAIGQLLVDACHMEIALRLFILCVPRYLPFLISNFHNFLIYIYFDYLDKLFAI
jgi:hypothetical protein